MAKDNIRDDKGITGGLSHLASFSFLPQISFEALGAFLIRALAKILASRFTPSFRLCARPNELPIAVRVRK